MPRSSFSRTIKRSIAIAVALVGLGSVALVATNATANDAPQVTSAAADDRSRINPVGTWAITVRFNDVVIQHTVSFTPSGRAFLGTNGPAGSGTWTSRGNGRFAWRIAEPTFDEAGTFTGWNDIDRTGTVTATTFSTSGTSTVHDLNENVILVVNATDEGVRIA